MSASQKAKGGVLLNDDGEVIGIIDSIGYSWAVASDARSVIQLVSEQANSSAIAIPISATIIKQINPSTFDELASKGGTAVTHDQRKYFLCGVVLLLLSRFSF